MKQEQRHERLDPRLAAAYSDLRAGTPEPDWDSLRGTIRKRAAPALRRRQARRFSKVPRPLVQLAAAASVAFALWMGPRLLLDAPASAPYADFAAFDDDAVLVEALLADVTEQEFRQLVTGRANPEALLAVAVGAR